ncbi:hypothetical protein Bbad01_06730 [Bacillus badius]|nr:hypothetical protein Bbad01_06730 [Bacillus badius]
MTKLQLVTENLLETITKLAEKAEEIYILTSFVMQSGVKRILPALQLAALRGAEIKICTGDYLCITQPEALQLLADQLPKIEANGDIIRRSAFGSSTLPGLYTKLLEIQRTSLCLFFNLFRSISSLLLYVLATSSNSSLGP